MDKKYINYSSQQLLDDESFLEDEKDATGECRKKWDLLATENENFSDVLKVTRIILAGMQNKKENNRLSSIDELSLWNQIGQSTYNYKKQQYRHLWIRRSIAAASVFLFCFILYQFIPRSEKEFDYLTLISSNASKLNGQNQEITLIISDKEKITVIGNEATVNYQKGYIELNANKYGGEKVEEIKDAFNQLIVPKGKRSFVTLADGTKMWVNAGSIVVYPVKFTDNKREIFVEGEIFLDVTPDKNKPFIVKTSDISIEVLGTQFNVSAYKADEMHHVILVEGKVEVKLPDKSKKIMMPNQQLVYSNNNWELHSFNKQNYLAWRYGYYQYDNQTIAEIVKSLAKYYGKSVSYDEKAGKLICTGKLDLKYDLHEVIETLADVASLQVEYSENNIHLFVKLQK
jgi:hypothetical protein